MKLLQIVLAQVAAKTTAQPLVQPTQVCDDTEIIVEKQDVLDIDRQLALLGLDPNSQEYADTVAELKLIKRSNPQLYRKAVGLD